MMYVLLLWVAVIGWLVLPEHGLHGAAKQISDVNRFSSPENPL
jgi:hypothetical protein